MFVRAAVIDVAQRPKPVHSGEPVHAPCLLVRASVLAFLCSMIMVLSVVFVARSGRGPQILDLPQHYLPDNPLPPGTRCSVSDVYGPRCVVMERDAYFPSDTHALTTIRALIPAQEFTLETLIAAWGTPTGITRLGNNLDSESTTYVHWKTFYVQLSVSSIQPDSRVRFIVYELDQSPAFPWHGFSSRED